MGGKIGWAARLKGRVSRQQVVSGDCPFVLIFLLPRTLLFIPKRLICRHPAAAPAIFCTIEKEQDPLQLPSSLLYK